ncbi:MAG: sterol desaturase family protein [Vampirovibrionales bacterium]|nr:sterol desaturase family protein [Vampirovibrionales bacterium]
MDLSQGIEKLADKLPHAAQYWLSKPFHVFTTAEERVFIPYILTTLLVAIIALGITQRKTIRQALKEIFNPKILKHPDTLNDLQYFYVNNILFWLVLIPMTAGILQACAAFSEGLVVVFGWKGALGHSTPLILGVFTVTMVIINDFGVYLTHRLQHALPFLWEFHKTHHSAEVLTPMTEYRIHPIDFLLGFVISFTLVGLFDGLCRGLFIEHLAEWKVLGVNVIQMAYYATFFNLRHSHIWVDFGPLNKLIISPAQHQIHHSDNPKHFDKNFGQLFGFWDWLFGTMYSPSQRETIAFGLGDPQEQQNFKSLAGLYLSPFIGVWQKWGFASRRKTASGKRIEPV